MTEELTQEAFSMDIMEIMQMLPHRYPFLLVDRITECVPGKYCKGYMLYSVFNISDDDGSSGFTGNWFHQMAKQFYLHSRRSAQSRFHF